MSNKGKSTDKKNNKATTNGKVQRKTPQAKPQATTTEMGALHGPVDNTAQLSAADMQDLQQTYGNRFVQRVSRQTPPAGNNASPLKATVQREGTDKGAGDVAPEIEGRIQSAQGGGHALPDDLRDTMEQSLGADFGNVNLHTDGEADDLNRGLQAEAFTVGSDIFFRNDTYAPGSKDGQGLLAHELTHVVQQGASDPLKAEETAPPTGDLTAAPASQDPEATEKQAEAKAGQKEAANELKTPEQEKEEAAKESRNEVETDDKKEAKKENEQEKEGKKKESKVPGKEEAEKAAGASASDLESQKINEISNTAVDSDIGPLLPTWSELAEGSIQLSADQATELETHGQTEVTPSSAEEAIDQSDLANDAVKEGAIAGLKEGAANLVMSMAMQAIAQYVPVADGIMAGAALVSDPEGWWKEEGAEGHSKRFLNITKTFGSFGEEDTDWGRAALSFEGVLAIVDFISRLVNTISNVLSITYAVTLPLSFMPFIGPFFTAITSFISPLLAPLGKVTFYLDITKMVLSALAGWLRYMDLLETDADPQKLMEKQAKLQGHVKAFVAEATTQAGEKVKDKGMDAYEDHKLKKASELPDNHPDKIAVTEAYDYKGKDTVAEWEARRAPDTELSNKKAEVAAKKAEVDSAASADKAARQSELETLQGEHTALKASKGERQKQREAAATTSELNKTQRDHDELRVDKPEDQKLLEKELHGLKARSGQEAPHSSFERWSMHREARGEAHKSKAQARETERVFKNQKESLGDARVAEIGNKKSSDVEVTLTAAKRNTSSKKEIENASKSKMDGHQTEQREFARNESEWRKKADDAKASIDKNEGLAAQAEQKRQTNEGRLQELRAKRDQVDDKASIDKQIIKLENDQTKLVAKKDQAVRDAHDARTSERVSEQNAGVAKGHKDVAARKVADAKSDYEAKQREVKAAEVEQKKVEDTLKYLNSKEKYEAAKKKNEEFVLTDAEKVEYDALKTKMKGEAEAGNPSTPDDMKRLRYLERMSQWQARSDRTFSGKNKDSWDAKRYTQYRFGGLELKEWIAGALPGGKLPEGKDWAAKYGGSAIKVNVNVFKITQASEPTAAEAEALIDGQRDGKGSKLDEYDIKVDPASGDSFQVEPKKTTQVTPIDMWLGKEADKTNTVMIKPGDANVKAKEKSGAKPTASWAAGKDITVDKGQLADIQVDYYKYEENSGATTPILAKTDPDIQRQPAPIQRSAEVEEHELDTGGSETEAEGGFDGFMQSMAAMAVESQVNMEDVVDELPEVEEKSEDEAIPTTEEEKSEAAEEQIEQFEEIIEENAAQGADADFDDEEIGEEDAMDGESEWPIDPANGLPMPPYETFDMMSNTAYTHRQLEAARIDQAADQEFATMMAVDAESQSRELAGARGMVNANQAAISLHNQDIDEKLASQKEMEQASESQGGNAQQGQQNSGQGNDLFSTIFTPLLTAVTLGQAHAGTGEQSGGVQNTQKGMGQQAEAGRMGPEFAAQGSAVSKQRQSDTLRAREQTKASEKQLVDLDSDLAADQASALTGSEAFELHSDDTTSQQEEIIDEQGDLAASYEEANAHAQEWADEHLLVRQELFGDLENGLE